MTIQKRVAALFMALSFVGIVINFATFGVMPDVAFNLVFNSICLLCFYFTIKKESIKRKYFQVFIIAIHSFFSIGMNSIPFFGSSEMVVSIVLFYVYNGYKTLTKIKTTITIILVFTFYFVGKGFLFNYERLAFATIWTIFTICFVSVLWIILKDYEEKDRIIVNNLKRDLNTTLKTNEQLVIISKDLIEVVKGESSAALKN